MLKCFLKKRETPSYFGVSCKAVVHTAHLLCIFTFVVAPPSGPLMHKASGGSMPFIGPRLQPVPSQFSLAFLVHLIVT